MRDNYEETIDIDLCFARDGRAGTQRSTASSPRTYLKGECRSDFKKLRRAEPYRMATHERITSYNAYFPEAELSNCSQVYSIEVAADSSHQPARVQGTAKRPRS
jgi:hypothetical protein